jgi:YfiH family protein
MNFLQFESLKNIPSLRHAITTRGNSCGGPYDELNLAYHVGDDTTHVTENRKKVAAELGYNAADLVAAQQIHGARANLVFKEGQGAFGWKNAVADCDALFTEEENIPLLIQVADCAPLLMVEEECHILAVVHAGWRGAVEKIASKTIYDMFVHALITESQLRVGIGPCLCVNCFEIGPEVAEAVQNVESDAILQRSEWQKPHLDLRLLIQHDLESYGVPPENIEIMPNCPKCENETFFSHRGQCGTAGRFGLVAWWDA